MHWLRLFVVVCWVYGELGKGSGPSPPPPPASLDKPDYETSAAKCREYTCGDSSQIPGCVATYASVTCYNRIRQLRIDGDICYGSTEKVGLDMVSHPGIHWRRIDCCSPFVIVPFMQVLGEYLVIRVTWDVYQENHTSGLWQQLGASKPPPMYDFPGLAAVMAGTLGTDINGSVPVYESGVPAVYDNTTCANRCCVLGLVDSSVVDPYGVECVGDWRRCVNVGFDKGGEYFPPCSLDPSAARCTVWVPCDGSVTGLEPALLFTVLFVFMVVSVVWRLKYYPESRP
jgi:hypothetical protein